MNNYSCSFFTNNHSACKHMFLVARRTRFRVSERVDEPSTQGSGRDGYTSSTTAQAVVVAQKDPHPQFSLSSHTLETSENPQHPPYTQESTAGKNPIAPTPQPSQNNIGDFSLQSYLDMMRGNTQPQPAPLYNPQSSDQQSNSNGMLLTNSQRQPRSQQHADHRIFSSNPRLTSTPLDPAIVPADDLDVYWEAPRK